VVSLSGGVIVHTEGPGATNTSGKVSGPSPEVLTVIQPEFYGNQGCAELGTGSGSQEKKLVFVRKPCPAQHTAFTVTRPRVVSCLTWETELSSVNLGGDFSIGAGGRKGHR